jgi:segregation and condensation protein B
VNVAPDRLAILEALLFVAEEPLPLSKLQEILADASSAETDGTLRDLAVRLESEGRGLMVQEVAGGFRLTTRPDVHAWIQKLQQVKPARLSRAALETLAIVAYRQPITRAEVEAIRGVAVDGVLRTLLERELVRMMGRKAEAGRPMLYGTSQQFLEHFGLRELGDLPTLREINELIGITETGAEIDAPAESTPPIADRPPIVDDREPVEEAERVADGPAAAAAGAALPVDDQAAAAEWGPDRGGGEKPSPDGRSDAATGDASVATAGASEERPAAST